MKNYRIYFLVLMVFMTYLPVVFNQFIGDDHLLVENNTFYSSWKNVPRLFVQGNIHQDKDIFANDNDHGTGFVGYRPVLSLTYFLDRSLWGNKPFGYHLTNIIIHCSNCILFFLIISLIIGPIWESFLAALLFGLHPIQSEAVAVIGYRADILSAFFVLSSFYLWIRFRSKDHPEIKYFIASLIMYFLALFSKEASALLPLVIFFYDLIWPGTSKSLKQRWVYYAGFISILIFYLYVYIFVFPNSSLSLRLMGGSVWGHSLAILHIWYIYVISFLAPWTIKLIPGLYSPPIPAIFSLEIFKSILFLGLFAWLICRSWKVYKPAAFLFCWFAVFYIPVSDLIPLANPMAFRFMYLPSVGALTLYALLLNKVLTMDFINRYSQRLSSMFYLLIILACVSQTVFINDRLRNDFNVGYTMLEHYPTASTGYLLVGQQYYVRRNFDVAKDYFEKAVRFGDYNPQIDLQLGICYFELGDFKNARQHLLSVVAISPDFLGPYIILGNIYYDQREYGQEVRVLEKALTLVSASSPIYLNIESLLRSARAHMAPQGIAAGPQ